MLAVTSLTAPWQVADVQMMDVFSPVQGRWDKSANKPGNRWEKQSHVDKARSTLCDVWESKLWTICFTEMRDSLFRERDSRKRQKGKENKGIKKKKNRPLWSTSSQLLWQWAYPVSRTDMGPLLGNSVPRMKLRVHGGEEDVCCTCLGKGMAGFGFSCSCHLHSLLCWLANNGYLDASLYLKL